MTETIYYDDIGNMNVRRGRRIYHDALGDRRGFRPDQIDIPYDDEIWLEIFEAIGIAAGGDDE